MRKISLFIAMSLDGYIADHKGSVDWLEGQGNDEEKIDSYADFSKNVDTVLMGWSTYHQVVTELSPDKWVYDDFTTYVFTHRNIPSSEKIRFTSKHPAALVKELIKEEGKDIWICGGANLIQQLVKENLIDHYYITVVNLIKKPLTTRFGWSEYINILKRSMIFLLSITGSIDLMKSIRMKKHRLKHCFLKSRVIY